MRIVAAHAHLVRLPLVHPFRSSTAHQTHRTATLIELIGPGGRSGWGECVADVTPYTAPDTARSVFESLDARGLADLVAGFRPDLGRLTNAAIDAALDDLRAKSADRPLVEQLGGEPGPVEVGVVIGTGDTATTLARTGAALDEGYRRVKLKVGPNGWRTVEAVRSTFPDAMLAVDANGSLTPSELNVDRLDDLSLAFVEQPFAPADLAAHARLRATAVTPVCLDESVRAPADLLAASRAAAVDQITIKHGMVGGVERALELAGQARAEGIGVWVGGMLETGIGRGHSLALARSPIFTAPADLAASARYFDRDITEPWCADRGVIHVGSGPGIGVSVDDDAVAAFTVATASASG